MGRCRVTGRPDGFCSTGCHYITVIIDIRQHAQAAAAGKFAVERLFIRTDRADELATTAPGDISRWVSTRYLPARHRRWPLSLAPSANEPYIDCAIITIDAAFGYFSKPLIFISISTWPAPATHGHTARGSPPAPSGRPAACAWRHADGNGREKFASPPVLPARVDWPASRRARRRAELRACRGGRQIAMRRSRFPCRDDARSAVSFYAQMLDRYRTCVLKELPISIYHTFTIITTA